MAAAQFECNRLSAPSANNRANAGYKEEHLYLDSASGSERNGLKRQIWAEMTEMNSSV